ncbi:dTDP-4-amino-4,6-dideoxygalactose transaminase [Algoriphagus winogradskyi]|uniref:dTDP-4-amino-4,6-dideoxygalactose transaminase n=1 Tax=Algoriphagus winogradskyi TaxID=237017 RepID=A0ABY1NW95_9BACT|nr:dTDP-4-amino-4,6-dideoxygalactose transaminase [Algoriphagus winogradskyi]SMP20092.1 dTDP-4-amino-4,6-dideoxygalactose transaminase [Algoriphagus winogradskyi]
MIPFNKPYITGLELAYIEDAVASGKLSGNGKYTRLAQSFFEEKYQIKKTLLTTSCTDALEMAAILIGIEHGDEVIIPSYTFVSTANAFVLRGAKIVFADSRTDHPGMDESTLKALITDKTKAIVPVHYAGVACDMDMIMELAEAHNLFVIEDAAQAIDSFYTSKSGKRYPLGSIGHLATFSFHETKNISSGEGGLLAINDEQFVSRAEIIWEKGTNRASFFRGEINKYGWVDIGSSFLPSEITAAFLWAQLEHVAEIQHKRVQIWNQYDSNFKGKLDSSGIKTPTIPSYAENNGHMYYLVARDEVQRDYILKRIKESGILAVFHYLSLHKSEFFHECHDGRELPFADLFSQRLIRLPFYMELTLAQVDHISQTLLDIVSEYEH